VYPTTICASEVARHLDAPNWVIVDCRFNLSDTEAGRHAYRQGHLPGAHYAHLDEDLSGPITAHSGRHPLPAHEALLWRLGRWGISEQSQVVAYDDNSGIFAARLWWLLRWLGHADVAILDGGWATWLAQGLPVSRAHPSASDARQLSMGTPLNMAVGVDEVERIRLDPTYRLLDVRAPERYAGRSEPIDPVAGHIPGAVNVPLAGNLDAHGCLLTAAALRERYRPYCHTQDASHIVIMCGSGVTACHSLLALEHAGLHGARLYAGSWSEWIRDPRRPTAKA
jgi:thiosulfate/3-mercaptopyruvate sulfurtransferase